MSPRSRLLTVLAVVVVVAVIVVVLVTREGDGPADAPVEQSSSAAYPSRGGLTDEQELLDAAAEAWRGVATEADRPTGQVEVLFADEVAGEDLPLSGDDRVEKHDVVILTSGDLVVTVIALGEDAWKVGPVSVVPRSARDAQALLPVGDLGYLMSAEKFSGTVPAVELPRSREEGDTGAELTQDERTPRPFEIDTTTGLWTPTVIISGDYAVRVPASTGEGFGGQAWTSAGTDGLDVVLQTETAGGPTADDALWEQLLGEQDSAAVVAALDRAAEAAGVVEDGTRYAGWTTKIRLWSLGGADVQVPDGARRVAAVGLGLGSDNGADVVTMGFVDPESGVTDDLVLGERPLASDLGMPTAATWVLYDSQAILFYASVDLTLDLQVGSEAIPTPSDVGAYLPASTGTEAANLPTTLLATSFSGERYASFPVGRVVARS